MMKKLFTIPLILFVSLAAVAGPLQRAHMAVIAGQSIATGGAADWCSSCTGTDGADVACLWHATNSCSTLSTSVGGINDISEITVPGTDPCSETGLALNVDIDNNSEDAYWIYDPIEVDHTSTYIYGWFRLNEENMNNNNYIELISGDDATSFGTRAFTFQVEQTNATTYRLALSAYTDLPGLEELNVGAFAIGTWVKFELELPNAGAFRIRIDGGSWVTSTNNFGGRELRYYLTGQDASARTGDFDMAYVHIDDDALSSGCAEN